MLVFVSDLHFSDGSNGGGVEAGSLDMFAQRLAELAMRASFRTDGRYRALDRIDLVLLGDTLDIMRSRRWLETEVRPWSDPVNPRLAETTGRIVDEILRVNDPALQILRAIAVEGAISLPPASSAGRPLSTNEGLSVPVAVHYMVGNADWPLHLRGNAFDLIRRRVCHALSLSNDHKQPFPHDAEESPELLAILRRHRTAARHGDRYDPLSCGDDRDASSLNDLLGIELIQRFMIETEMLDLSPALTFAIRELDHFRPLPLAAAYLEGIFERTESRPAVRKELKRLWDRLAEGVLQSPLVSERGRLSPFQLTEELASSLLFSRRTAIGWTENTRRWTSALRGATGASYAPHALTEPDFRNRRAQHIVFGHTHTAETIPLDASYADGYVLQQTYFNTGTWRRTYQTTQALAGDHEFIACDTLSFLTVFQGDERSGRPYETWSGSLGVGGELPSSLEQQPRTTSAPIAAPRSESIRRMREQHA